ncbi:hypothetical protein [Geoglobus acetivorans]|uniref:hypothetical protein n=1 Tax=Geoglobus acetivorans TaxID=565033 RepID=UPI00064E5272
MSVIDVIKSVKKGEDVLFIYPDNDVFLAFSKLITKTYGKDEIGWFVFNEIAKKRLEKLFKIFNNDFSNKIYTSYDEIDRRFVIAYGYHFYAISSHFSDDALIRLILDDDISLFCFIYDRVVEEKRILVLKDLFDYVVDIREKEAPLDKEFFYRVKAYVMPHIDHSAYVKIDERYNLFE